jgi:hypothetical protein
MPRLLVLAVLLSLTGCASQAYQRAKDADTAEAYRDFLREYPKDDMAEPAEARLEELDFAEAEKLHTVLAYKRFIEEHPEAGQVHAARALLEGLRFNAAKEAGTVTAWRQFLADHPDGAHKAEAQQALAKAEQKDLATTEDPKRLSAFLREAGDDPRRLEVEARLDDQTYAKARASGAAKLLRTCGTSRRANTARRPRRGCSIWR